MKLEEKKQILARYDALLPKGMYTISFSKHTFTVELTEIRFAKLTDLENNPNKREKEDGKKYTPDVLQLVFSGNDTLDLVYDRITESYAALNGIVIKVGPTEITLVCTS